MANSEIAQIPEPKVTKLSSVAQTAAEERENQKLINQTSSILSYEPPKRERSPPPKLVGRRMVVNGIVVFVAEQEAAWQEPAPREVLQQQITSMREIQESGYTFSHKFLPSPPPTVWFYLF